MTNLAAFAHADAPLVPVSSARVVRRRLRARRGAPQRAVVGSGEHRFVGTARDETYRRRCGARHLRATDRVSGGCTTDGSVEFVRVQTHRRTVEKESEAFFLRITKEGDYFYEGADLGILITPGRLMTRRSRAHRPREGVDRRNSGPIRDPAGRIGGAGGHGARRGSWKLQNAVSSGPWHVRFCAVREQVPGERLRELFEDTVAGLPCVVPRGGRRRATVLYGRDPSASTAHARASADVRTARRALGRRGHAGPFLEPVPPDAIPHRLLAGGLDARTSRSWHAITTTHRDSGTACSS